MTKKSSATPHDIYEAFATDEPFKSVAKRFCMSPNTLRRWWVDKFGQEAFDARGKAIQAKAAVEFGHAHKGRKHKVGETESTCSSCGVTITLNLIQKARTTRPLCSECEATERGADRNCPVCGFACVGVKGFASHFAHADEAHQIHLHEQEEAHWAGKIEGVEYVCCQVCGHRAMSLQTHLRSHALTAEDYRAMYSGALVLCSDSSERRSAAVTQSHIEAPRAGFIKTVFCSSCEDPHEIPLTSSSKDFRCPECRERDQETYWASLTEGAGYVTCQVCGYRTEESLVSHIRNVHPELEGKYKDTFPGALVISSASVLRDRTHLQGVTLSLETRAKMSANAGKWNKGLTKETDERMAQAALNMIGRKSWRKGLTKEDHPGVLSTSDKMRVARSVKHWNNGNEITLTKGQLLPFALKNGKISVGKAIAALGHAFVTIKRECAKHGLQISHTAIQQAICLELVSQALGGVAYETEWSDPQFTNHSTGRRFRFDGFFRSHDLIVEFHGYQHYIFPSCYIQDEEEYFKLQERDRLKENLIHGSSILRYFLVREDEPYADVGYLRARLINEGILQKFDLDD